MSNYYWSRGCQIPVVPAVWAAAMPVSLTSAQQIIIMPSSNAWGGTQVSVCDCRSNEKIVRDDSAYTRVCEERDSYRKRIEREHPDLVRINPNMTAEQYATSAVAYNLVDALQRANVAMHRVFHAIPGYSVYSDYVREALTCIVDALAVAYLWPDSSDAELRGVMNAACCDVVILVCRALAASEADYVSRLRVAMYDVDSREIVRDEEYQITGELWSAVSKYKSVLTITRLEDTERYKSEFPESWAYLRRYRGGYSFGKFHPTVSQSLGYGISNAAQRGGRMLTDDVSCLELLD